MTKTIAESFNIQRLNGYQIGAVLLLFLVPAALGTLVYVLVLHGAGTPGRAFVETTGNFEQTQACDLRATHGLIVVVGTCAAAAGQDAIAPGLYSAAGVVLPPVSLPSRATAEAALDALLQPAAPATIPSPAPTPAASADPAVTYTGGRRFQCKLERETRALDCWDARVGPKEGPRHSLSVALLVQGLVGWDGRGSKFALDATKQAYAMRRGVWWDVERDTAAGPEIALFRYRGERDTGPSAERQAYIGVQSAWVSAMFSIFAGCILAVGAVFGFQKRAEDEDISRRRHARLIWASAYSIRQSLRELKVRLENFDREKRKIDRASERLFENLHNVPLSVDFEACDNLWAGLDALAKPEPNKLPAFRAEMDDLVRWATMIRDEAKKIVDEPRPGRERPDAR